MAKISSKSKEIINKIQEALKINELSKDESEGQLNNKSLFKFFRGSALMVPFSIGRTIRGVRFTKQALDPFSSCLEKQNMHKFNANIFAKDLYDICDTETSFLVRNFIKTLTNPEIINLPSWTIAFPWEKNGFLELKEKYLEMLIENRKEFNEHPIFKENCELDTYQYAMSHGTQFKNLISKIITEGFDLRHTRPGVFILKNKNNWRWIMGGNGNHRAYIMSALKYPALPASIIEVVDRSKSSQWNNVQNGNYTKMEAEEIFDTVFRGDTRIRGCV